MIQRDISCTCSSLSSNGTREVKLVSLELKQGRTFMESDTFYNAIIKLASLPPKHEQYIALFPKVDKDLQASAKDFKIHSSVLPQDLTQMMGSQHA